MTRCMWYHGTGRGTPDSAGKRQMRQARVGFHW